MTAKYTLYSTLALLLLLPAGCGRTTSPQHFNELVAWDTITLNDRYTHPLEEEAVKEAGLEDSYYTEISLLSPRVEQKGHTQLRKALNEFQEKRLAWLKEHILPDEEPDSLRDTTAISEKTLPGIVEGYARARKAEYLSMVEELAKNHAGNLPILSLSVNQMTAKDWLAYNQQGLVSILEYLWAFAGGAHGAYSYTGIIYDLKNERIVTPELLLKPESTEQINALILQELLRINDADSADELEELGFSYLEEARITPNMLLSPGGLTFIYNVYELGAYALGYSMITLSFDELAPHLAEEYAYLAEHD